MDKYGIDLWYSGGSKNAGNGRYYIQQGVANYTADSTDEDPTVAIYGINDYGEKYSEIVHLNDIDPTNATYGEFNALYQHIAETSSQHISPNGTFFAIDALESMHFQYDKKYNFLAQLDLMSEKYQGIHDYRDVSQIQDMKTALINNFNEKNSQGIKAGDNPAEPIFYASDIENSQSGVSLETAGEYSKMIQKIEEKIDKEQMMPCSGYLTSCMHRGCTVEMTAMNGRFGKREMSQKTGSPNKKRLEKNLTQTKARMLCNQLQISSGLFYTALNVGFVRNLRLTFTGKSQKSAFCP